VDSDIASTVEQRVLDFLGKEADPATLAQGTRRGVPGRGDLDQLDLVPGFR
jgi:hypothetical protein